MLQFDISTYIYGVTFGLGQVDFKLKSFNRTNTFSVLTNLNLLQNRV